MVRWSCCSKTILLTVLTDCSKTRFCQALVRQGLQVKAHVAAPKPLQMLLNGTNLEKKILPERWAVNVAGQARLLTPYK